MRSSNFVFPSRWREGRFRDGLCSFCGIHVKLLYVKTTNQSASGLCRRCSHTGREHKHHKGGHWSSVRH